MFCGLGGNSAGAKKVKGTKVVLGLNHWQLACQSYGTNHQETDIECADVSNTDPRRYGRTNILIASPECTKHSPAGGRVRKNPMQVDLFKQKIIDPKIIKSRATMNDVVAFAEVHRYDIIIIENVVEVLTWELFDIWLMSLHRLGYEHEMVFLNAMFVHGQGLEHFAPQSRDRIYIVFWKKGNKKPDLDYRPLAHCQHCGKDVHGRQAFKPGGSKLAKYETQYIYVCGGHREQDDHGCGRRVYPYFYSALNAIDLSIPIKRIRDRSGKSNEPFLSQNTLDRCRYGLEKYGWRPIMLNLQNSSGSYESRMRLLGEDQMFTQATGYNTYAMFPPTEGIIVDTAHSHAQHGGKTKSAGQEALPTGTTQLSASLLLPEVFFQANRNNSPMHPAGEAALHTATTGGGDYVVMPAGASVQVQHGTSHARPLDLGLNTTETVNKSSVLLTPELKAWLDSVQGFTSPYHGNNHQARAMWETLTAITAKGGMTYTEARGAVAVEDCYWRALQPSETKRGQGFTRDYQVLGSKADQQRQIGNANPPNTMEWLIGRCVDTLA